MEIQPEDMTLEQTREQMMLYSGLYYQKRRNDKDYIWSTKERNSNLRPTKPRMTKGIAVFKIFTVKHAWSNISCVPNHEF